MTSSCPHHLQVLHQSLIGEMITDQEEPIQVAARLDRVPIEQLLCYGRHGVLLYGIVCVRRYDPLAAAFLHAPASFRAGVILGGFPGTPSLSC